MKRRVNVVDYDASPTLGSHKRVSRSRRSRSHSETESELSAGYLTCSDSEQDYNEKIVDDISIEFLYAPRTLTLLVFVIASLVLFAVFRDANVSQVDNYKQGISCVVILFVPISLLCFPNGPFTRPHPAVWRIVCGFSIAYQLFLSFALFQSAADVHKFLVMLYPDLAVASNDSMKIYAENCELTAHNVYMSLDFFSFAHFTGYIMKSLLVRHAALMWILSIMWELTELLFMHLLPNFAECWWDILILDVLLCNGIGIHVGMWLAQRLEMGTYHWESVKDIRTASGKIQRMILQFTPVSWKRTEWSRSPVFLRCCAILLIIFLFQVCELNLFVFKHIFAIPSSHKLLMWHRFFLMFTSAPAIRQYYMYVTDPNRTRIGTHFWFFFANTLTEALLNLCFGKALFKDLNSTYFVIWLTIQILLSIAAVITMVWFTTEQRKARSSGGVVSRCRARDSIADD